MSEEMRLDEQALMQQALVGTQRLEAFDPQWPDALLALLRDANEAAPAPKGAHRASVQLLRAAGAAGLLGRAGHLPAACGTAPDLSVAPDDALAAPTDASVIEALSAALREGSADLICQSWNLLARAGLRLPFTLLPAALDAGARNTALREDLLAVLGARGLWLAEQNPAWKYAAGADQQADPEKLWLEGAFEQRLAVLRDERARNPAAARERFEAALKELGAKERLAMLEVLNARLSMDDEALLERLLTDRSGEVRQLAAEQLSALPESAHAQRVIAWVEPLLRRDGEKAGWTIEPPEKENADWPRDGIAIKPHGFFKGGERAWWLYQLTRMTPPDWWTRHLDMTPEALFAWTGKTEWQRPIRDGLLEAAARAPGRDWLQLLTSMQGSPHARESLNVLLNAMTQTEREAYWQQRLEAAPKLVFELLVRMGELMRPADHLPRTLSDALVVAIAQTYDQTATNRDWSVRHTLSQALVSAALWLAPQSLPGLLAIIDKANSAENAANAQAQAQSYGQVWQRVRTIAGIRQTLCAIST